MQRTTATATYHARILKLRLPEQDLLRMRRNAARLTRLA